MDKECNWKLSYTAQLTRETKHFGLEKAIEGTAGFRRIGCDKCDGLNTSCRKYNLGDAE